MTEKVFSIKSIAEYIEVLRSIQHTNRSVNTTMALYYRGQSKRYISNNLEQADSIVASNFRDNTAVHNEKLNFNENKVAALYRMIANQLTPLEAENFIAYCQHHGLFTQLIDITEDPMVALYFAVENIEDDDNDGVIYIFKHNNMIDISDEMIGNLEGFDSIRFLMDNSSGSIEKALKYFAVFESQSDSFIFHFKDLIDKIIIKYTSDTLEENDILLNKIVEFNEINSAHDDYEYILNLINFLSKETDVKDFFLNYFSPPSNHDLVQGSIYDSNFLFNLIYRDCANLFPWYTLILKNFISTNKSSLFYPSADKFSMPLLPNFIYKPTIIFDRMLDQSGSFIVQGIFRSHVRDTVETIKPDFIINVKDKNSIRESLELLGIKRTKYFNDVDNLASFLNKNYY